MEDPAYKNGVKSESIVNMLESVTHVFKGKSSYILAPVPVDKIAPVTHVSFYQKRGSHPKPLTLQHKAPQSRRAYSHSLSNGSDHTSPVVESQNSRFVQDIETNSTHDEIMSTIEDFTALSTTGDDDVVVEDVVLESSSTDVVAPLDVQQETVTNASIPTTTGPVARRRRRVGGS